METKRKADPLFITLVVLIFLILLSSTLVGGFYARYVSNSAQGDHARVAKFDIVESGQEFQQAFAISLDPQENTVLKDGAVVLTNNSEVDVRCTFYTESTENLPLTYTWTGDGLVGTVDPETSAISFVLDSNGEAKTFDLAITWDLADPQNSEFIYNRQVDGIVLKILCEQID